MGLGRWIGAEIEAEQDRWFLWVPVLFGLGIAAYFAWPIEPWLAPAIVALAGALVLAAFWRVGAFAVFGTGALVGALAGFVVAKGRSDLQTAPVLARQLPPRAVEGWVELVEPRPQQGARVTLRVHRLEGLAAAETPVRVRVRTPRLDAALKPGDGVRIRATLSPPAGPALPGGFDFARSAWFQQLGGVGYAREAAVPIALPDPPLGLRLKAPIERLRQTIGARITAALPGETGAIAMALITGERGGISDATNDAFRDSGLLHILSISGLHMVIMAGAVFVSVRFLLTLVPWIALRFPIKKWAAAAAALGALGYLLISGSSFPTVRSYIMISIMFLAVMLDRPAVALRNVALAALAILLLYPESLVDVGFQMSFAAVVALVAAYEVLRERETPKAGAERHATARRMLVFFGGIMLSTLIASLAVAPLAAYHFHKSQQYAMIANLIAIPICNVLVMPAALAALVALPFGLEAWPLKAMGLGIEAMVWCAYTVAALPGAVGRIPETPTLAIGLMVAGGLWICLWRRRWRALGLIAVLAGLAAAPLRSPPDLLVGREGLVAVRGADGRLAALGGRSSSFELARWLEHDGDGRRPEEASAAGAAFRCDWTGCIATVKGRRIAIARHPAALADDCRLAGVVVVPMLSVTAGARTTGCRPPAIVIDAEAVRRHGTHALRLGPPDGIAIATVAATRGDRPWAPVPTERGGNDPFVVEAAEPSPNASPGRRAVPSPPPPDDEP